MKSLLILLFTISASAQTLTLNPANESSYGVNLNTSVNFNDVHLPLTGTGLGTKKVGILKVKIAVNELFTQFPENFVRTDSGVLQSLTRTGIMAMRVTFLRTLTTLQLHTFIQDYISSNLTTSELAQYDNDISNLTNAIDSDNSINIGKSVIFVTVGNNIYYQNTQGTILKIFISGEKFINKVMSIWFGPCSDTDCRNLKASMLSVPTVTRKNNFNKPLFTYEIQN